MLKMRGDEMPKTARAHFRAGCVVGLTMLAALASAHQTRAEPSIQDLTQLEAIYVADPAAPWFEKWTEINVKVHDWIYRPSIRIRGGGELVEAVAASQSGIGLLTAGELERLRRAGAPQVAATPTGLSVCAAFSVHGSRSEETVGDFALSSDKTEVLATTDTLAIAEALVDAHGFRDRMIVKQIRAASVSEELSPEKPAVVALPVLPAAALHVPENVAELRPLMLTEVATEALRMRGLNPQHYRTSVFHRLPFITGIRTACDEIVLITAPGRTFAASGDPGAQPSSWHFPFTTGSELESRIRQALETFRLLWQKSANGRG
jgi:hypothetical protein